MFMQSPISAVSGLLPRPASEIRDPAQQPLTRISEAKGRYLLYIILVPLFDLKLLTEFASNAGGSFKSAALEHDPEKWKPVFGKDHAQTKNLGHDPIQLDRIMA
jgi:hypothetical protein